MINRPKGTKDVIPSEVFKWQVVEGIAKLELKNHGFSEIRTPVFEHTELFVRGVGEGSDIVNKEMYTFLDKGERSITLKPEGTASIVRAIVENGLDNEAMPLKLFMLTPCFRYERPQAGRLREHHQFSIEAFGSYSPLMDAEVISVVKSILDRLSFTNYLININSIGCKHCRGRYMEALKAYYSKFIGGMCADCKVRFEKNPLRLLDCKEEGCAAFKANAPKPIDFICDECRAHFEALKAILDQKGVRYKVNNNLVRGIDYYTRTVFEFLTEEKGALNVICGGGRYDGLVSELGGKELPAVGIGLGIEHLLLLLEKNGINIQNNNSLDLFVVNADESAIGGVIELVTILRKHNVSADFDTLGRSMKAQMKYANKLGAKNVIVLGGNEIASGVCKVKDMETGEETEASLKDISKLAYVLSRRA
ncbi:MAG: histidine--tRNA ligase [Clostridia bacterium]|nr:histidine--tRNA ligase [Clostridia bacterium]